MACYLVTGGAGFIGSHIVDELVRRGETVRVLDDFSSGRRENIAHNLEHVELLEGSLCDLEMVRRAVAGMDYVLHLGAIPSVPRSVAAPLASHQANVTGTLHVLLAAREAQVRRVVYSSSSSVYGNSPTLPKHEDMPTHPLSPYAVSKLAGENYCTAFHEVYGLPTVSLRYFNVFGPRQDPNSEYAAVIPKFITAMLKDESPIIYGDGLQSRDFTYVTNVVAANLRACEREDAVGQVMNVALGDRVTLLELVEELNGILGTQQLPRFEAERPGDVKHSQADASRAKALLGLERFVNFRQGLRETVGWFRN
ncbi:MAG: SDR family oxidoreductase [Anaerolineae bacterium]|nr:SDR family oxidoreductase [Anaerolineae bacterium]